MSLKLWFIISFAVYLIPALFGGLPFLPKALWNLRNPLYLSLAVFLFGLFQTSFRKEVSAFFKDPQSFMTSELSEKYIKRASLFYLLIYLKLVLVNYFNFNVIDVDFSYFDLMIANFIRGNGWFSEACNCNHFGVHSTYIFYFLAPFHRIFNSPLFLVVIHALILWSAIIPLKKLLLKREFPPIFNLILIIGFFNYSAIIHNLKYNFHFEVFYIPLFFWLFHFLEEKKWSHFYIVSLIVFSIKEDAGFYMLGLSSAMFFFYSRKHSLILALFSILMTFISLKLVIPHFRGTEDYTIAKTALKYGESMSEAILFMIKNPHYVLKDVLTGHWLRFLIPSLFTVLFDPIFMLINLPFIVIHSTAGSHLMSSLMLYYSAPFVPFIWISFLRWLKGDYKRTFFLDKLSQYKPHVLCFFILYSSLVGSGFITFKPVTQDIFDFQKIYRETKKGSKVCAQGSILPHFGYDFEIRPLPQCYDQGFDYIVLNPHINHYPYPLEKIQSIISHLKSKQGYELKEYGRFLVFKKSSI